MQSLMHKKQSSYQRKATSKDNFPTFITKKYEIKRNITVHNNKKIRRRHKRNGYKSFMLFIQPEKNPPSAVHFAFFPPYNRQQRKGQKFSINLPYQLTPIVHLLTFSINVSMKKWNANKYGVKRKLFSPLALPPHSVFFSLLYATYTTLLLILFLSLLFLTSSSTQCECFAIKKPKLRKVCRWFEERITMKRGKNTASKQTGRKGSENVEEEKEEMSG